MFEKQALDILVNFDWEKVRAVMRHLDWRWGEDPTPPSLHQLMASALDHLRRAWAHGEGSFSESGGFRAECADGRLRLCFNLTSWDYDPEDHAESGQDPSGAAPA